MEKFQFDVISQTLTITAQFAKMMNDPESDEYKLVMRFRQDFPNLTITKKTHKSATHCTTKSGEKFNCNQFKNLTYDRMRWFTTGTTFTGFRIAAEATPITTASSRRQRKPTV